jgi:CubicO group peptidase (beta-lactamase class C family)
MLPSIDPQNYMEFLMKNCPLLPAFFFAITLLFSCEKDTPAPVAATYYYPPATGSAWETVDPADLGWNVNKLNEAIEFVEANNSTAFIILYKGRIVTERYWLGSTPSSSRRIFSSTKSIAGFLIGLAQEQGKLDITKKVSFYLGSGWSHASAAQENSITVKHLITMTSGLNEELTYDTIPGTKWTYNTLAYHKLYNVLSVAYGQSNTQYTNEQLWSKIGMQNSFWDTEPGGGPSMSCSGRDMARFGLLLLSGGKWAGNAIMNDTNYFQSMLNSSQTLNPSYGYLWWLNGKSSYILPTGDVKEGSLMPSGPPDLVAALGYGDKKIYVVKSKDLVVIRHGGPSNFPVNLALSSFDNEIWKRLMLAIE